MQNCSLCSVLLKKQTLEPISLDFSNAAQSNLVCQTELTTDSVRQALTKLQTDSLPLVTVLCNLVPKICKQHVGCPRPFPHVPISQCQSQRSKMPTNN